MSVRRCRNEVANAEALFAARLAQTYDTTQRMFGEVRAAASPVTVGLAALLTGGTLYFVRPRFATLLRLPMLIGAVDSLVQHVGRRASSVALQDTGPPA